MADPKKGFEKKTWPVLRHFIFFLPLVIAVGCFFLSETVPYYISWISVFIIDAYLIALLWQAARSSDWKHSDPPKSGTPPKNIIMPSRKEALFILIGFGVTLIIAFATIYLHSAKEMATSETNIVKIITTKDSAGRQKNDTTYEVIKNFNSSFTTRHEAVYFSFVTMLTLGYGDIHPVSKKVKRYVILQLVSAFLLLLGRCLTGRNKAYLTSCISTSLL